MISSLMLENVYSLMILAGRVLLFLAGLLLVIRTFVGAVRSFVLPRAEADLIQSVVFTIIRQAFELRLRFASTFAQRDRIMALYAPISLLMLPPVWLTLTLFGYMAMFWAVRPMPLLDVFLLSGSSLLTLGFAAVYTLPQMILAFTEATIGLILVALLIAYLPTMYSTFSRREAGISQFVARAGSPPAAVEMIARMTRIDELKNLRQFWEGWEVLFSEIEESHTSLPALVFFRSGQSEYSWVTVSGTVMDTAAIILSCVDVPDEPKAALAIRAGFLALQRIAAFFGIDFDPSPTWPKEPISIERHEFDEVTTQLREAGVPLKDDMEQAWEDFAGWRVNYDRVLLALCALTMAPPAPWSSDRAPAFRLPPMKSRTRVW